MVIPFSQRIHTASPPSDAAGAETVWKEVQSQSMKSTYPDKRGRYFRLLVWAVAEALTVGCLIYSICIKNIFQAISCAVYAVGISGPFLIEKWFKCKINTLTLLCSILYALGPLMGDMLHLYYTTGWWDKLLHFTGGIMFAMLGVFLPQMLSDQRFPVSLCAVFALCFSITISVCWEFCEYGIDQLFGTDLQHSMVVHDIHSHLLAEEVGEVGSIGSITEVTVNGESLPLNGYLDIGLNDTMLDMLVESFGALIYVVIYVLDKGRHLVLKKEAAVQV